MDLASYASPPTHECLCTAEHSSFMNVYYVYFEAMLLLVFVIMMYTLYTHVLEMFTLEKLVCSMMLFVVCLLLCLLQCLLQLLCL